MAHISLINDISNTSSPNAVNERGRKLCPITMDIVTTNNSINIEGVIYSTKGFSNWVRRELEIDYDRLTDICNLSELVNMKKDLFIKYIYIRSPMTNLPYCISTISTIYNIFVDKYHLPPIICVYEFINNL